MNVIKLKSDISEFLGVFHVADIHIRLTKRHDEYLSVFSQLYEAVKKTPANTCVCVLGDLFHSKSDLSPECVQIAADFLKTLSDLRPTVLISGNHDATLTNKNRLDSLSPVVNSLNHPNLFYLKENGLYILGDILFNNMSVFEEPDKYIKASDIPQLYRNQTRHLVGLFHGPVNEALTDVGYRVNNRSVTTDLFDGHDIVLLGDIHMAQQLFVEKEMPSDSSLDDHLDTEDWTLIEGSRNRIRKTLPKILYCGSTIQQNHGESLNGHGYVIWNLKTREFKHFDVENEYGYFTIDINKGKLVTDLSNLPKKVRLRIRCFETVASEVKEVVAGIKKLTDIVEVTYVRSDVSPGSSNKPNDVKDLNLTNIVSVDYQNNLIKEFITNKLGKVPDESFLAKVYTINAFYNSIIDKDKSVRNIRWKPKKFTFSNMFSYGEDNVIDFSKMKDVIGIFSENASGKSSILSSLSFCIFDKTDRTFKASHVLNSQKMSFKCEFNFEINGVDYFIRREGKADKKGNVKVDVKFWKVENDKIVELNGEARRSTNDLIRDHLGTYEDFILTVLSIQNNKVGSFIDMGQSERKDLLSQFMGLNIFDALYQPASDKMKEMVEEIKILNRNDGWDCEDSKFKLECLKEGFKSQNLEHDEMVNKKNELSSLLLEETKKLINLEKSIPTDLSSLVAQKKSIEESISNTNISINEEKLDNEKISLELSSVKSMLMELNQEEIKKNFLEFTSLKTKLSFIESEIEKRKLFISSKIDKINKLKSHEYDPNCKYCIDNKFVKDAMSAKDTLSADLDEAKKIKEDYESVKNQIEKIKNSEELFLKFESLSKKLLVLDRNLSMSNKDVMLYESRLTGLNESLKKTSDLISVYFQRKEDIEKNVEIESRILTITNSIKKYESMIKDKNKSIMDFNSKITALELEIKNKSLNLKRVKDLEEDLGVYESYVSAVSRDGIPFDLISKAVPFIEKEANSILSQIVEFGVNIQTDGKSVITNIVYNDKKWPLELSSGLEKFLTSLVLRVALINISNLPRPNFIAIDEGFGCADGENLSSMASLFSILKTNFDFMLIISHLDSMKDMVQSSIQINKENGFSKITY